MSQAVGVRLDDRTVERLKEEVENDEYDSISEAARTKIQKADSAEVGLDDALDRVARATPAELLTEDERRAGATAGNLADVRLNNVEREPTGLESAASRLGDAFAFATIMMIGATFLYPLAFRVFVVVPLLASLTCYGIRRLLREYEPAVSARLPWGGQA